MLMKLRKHLSADNNCNKFLFALIGQTIDILFQVTFNLTEYIFCAGTHYRIVIEKLIYVVWSRKIIGKIKMGYTS